MCGKPKFGSALVLKKPNRQKNVTSVQTVFLQKLHAIRRSNKK